MHKRDLETVLVAPFAELLRPKMLNDIVGQEQLLGPQGRLSLMLAQGVLGSIIFWGPPGTGKTKIARLLADAVDMVFEPISAVFDGVAELRKVFFRAEQRRKQGRRTLLFVDEVHWFSKAQQDRLLPRVEDGTVTLIGATTENPSFVLNGALLSRVQVLVLDRLDHKALETILLRLEEHVGHDLSIDRDARTALLGMADGDGRYLLNIASLLVELPASKQIDSSALMEMVAGRAPAFDRAGDQHYNWMSALHKTLRSSDADAGLYWLARIMAGGEDSHYILRRLTRFAAEDIGLSEPEVQTRALTAWQAYERLGSPEGDLAIAGLVIYLPTVPKSNATYLAFKAASQVAAKIGSLSPPLHLLNVPTKLMK